MRTVDVFYAFPSVLLAIALSGALGAGIGNALLSLTLVFVPQVARIAESVTAQVRHMDYIEAARATGASAFTIIRVQSSATCWGRFLSLHRPDFGVHDPRLRPFFGLGVRPEPEWGLMLNTLRTAIYTQPWVAALPGLMILSPPFRSTSSLTACARRWRLRSNDATFYQYRPWRPGSAAAEGQSAVEVFSCRWRKSREVVQAVDNVSFTVMKGETLGVVGSPARQIDDGARLLMQLLNQDSGELIFDG